MFRQPLKPKEIWSCTTAPAWQSKGICGIVPDVDAGGVLTQPYSLRQVAPEKNIIPEDVYATRPFYFGGSNVRFYDQNADSLRLKYGFKKQ